MTPLEDAHVSDPNRAGSLFPYIPILLVFFLARLVFLALTLVFRALAFLGIHPRSRANLSCSPRTDSFAISKRPCSNIHGEDWY